MRTQIKRHKHLLKTNKPYKIINEILDAMLIASLILGGILWIAL
jgi:hypothetical protein